MSLDERLIGALHLSSGPAGSDPAPGHRAFQTSTVAALLDGAYEGDVTFAELARRGDFGIGTLNGCDGEMIALEGRFLRADASGAIGEIPPTARTPFAVLTRFESRRSFTLEPAAGEGEGWDFDRLCAEIDERVGGAGIVHAIRIDGRFRSVHCRSVPKQRKPYRPLAEVLAEQRTFELAGLAGTIVGFRFPNLGLGVGIPGYHLHFVDCERSRGGHVLGLRADAALAVAVDDLPELHVETPPGVEIGGRRLEQAMVDALERDDG